MFAKIKDIEIGTSLDNFDFLSVMKLEGIWEFCPIDTSNTEDWAGWWQIRINDPTDGCVYHESWLERVNE